MYILAEYINKSDFEICPQVANEVIAEMNLRTEEVMLGQGTLRPDLIESASSLVSGNAQSIKTHHNDTDRVRLLRAEGRVVEPLKDFHKDEVRKNLSLYFTPVASHVHTKIMYEMPY